MAAHFLVPRIYLGTPFELTNDAPDQIAQWYRALDPFDRAVGYGLFALTVKKRPAAWQEIRLAKLLDVMNLNRVPDNGSALFHGRHYRRARIALLRLANNACPVRRRSGGRGGPGVVQMPWLQDLCLIYRDRTGGRIDLRAPQYKKYRIDLIDRHQADLNSQRYSVYALLQSGEQDTEVRSPVGYRFLWSSGVATALGSASQGKGKNGGWLMVPYRIFEVLKSLRAANSVTASRLFELVIGDIINENGSPERLVKPAKLMFHALGFPQPGARDLVSRHNQDGRWAENVAKVEKAVKTLKELGVLGQDSDETPHRCASGFRYRWHRKSEWTLTDGINIQSQSLDDLPGAVEGPAIRKARRAAGLTQTEFSEEYGGSKSFWSHVENGRKLIPARLHDKMTKFVDDYVLERS